MTASGWARAPCPYCALEGKRDKKASFGILVAKGIFQCFRCGVSGHIDVPEDFHQRTPAPPSELEAMGPPEGFVPLWEEPGATALCLEDARAYLARRGVGRRLVRVACIGAVLEGRYHGRVIVPVLGGDGVWIGWVGRSWAPSELPYIYPGGEWRGAALYNRAALAVATDEPVLVVEGVFDALAHWPHAVAVLGKPSAFQFDALLEAKRPVVVVLDGDAWTEGLALAMRLRFRGQRAGSVRLPPKLDPDEVPKSWLDEEARRCLA